ncbi:MAG: hypothetical protein WBF01_15255, partial [Candidatus Acidiferrum sp.]
HRSSPNVGARYIVPLFSARRLAQTRRDDAPPNSNNVHPKRSEGSAFLFAFLAPRQFRAPHRPETSLPAPPHGRQAI